MKEYTVNSYPTLNYVSDMEKVRKDIRKEWVWYRKALNVVTNKPKLNKKITEILNFLEWEYEVTGQTPPPPSGGSSAQKDKG